MAFRLIKTEETRLNELQTTITEAYGNLESAVAEYNEKETELRTPVNSALATYNVALGELRSFAQNIATEKRGEFEDETESWQESETGQSVDEWINSWEMADLEDVSIAYPDELQLSFESHTDEIDLPLES
jgi:hypothetical protein